jgi:hypothetical protein
MKENSKRINIAIPAELYNKVDESKYGLTEAIVKGLELLMQPKDNRVTELQEQVTNLTETVRLQASIIQESMSKQKEYENPIPEYVQEHVPQDFLEPITMHDINVEHYTDKLERTIDDTSEDQERYSLQASHKAPIPIHEHIHKLHSEPISETLIETKEPVDEEDFFDMEPEPAEKPIEESIGEIPLSAMIPGENGMYRIECTECNTVTYKTQPSYTCSDKCRMKRSRRLREERAKKAAL